MFSSGGYTGYQLPILPIVVRSQELRLLSTPVMASQNDLRDARHRTLCGNGGTTNVIRSLCNWWTAHTSVANASLRWDTEPDYSPIISGGATSAYGRMTD